MLVIDTPDRKRVLAPRPAAAASKPVPRGGASTHPVQPTHVSAASKPPGPGVPSAAGARQAPRAGGGRTQPESLAHALGRMLDQGYSAKQVEGELRRWHPDWSPTRIRAAVRSAGNPAAFTPKTNGLPRTAGVSIKPKRGHRTPERHHKGGGILDDISTAYHEASRGVRDTLRVAERVAADVQRTELDVYALFPYTLYYLAYTGLGYEHRAARRTGPLGDVLNAIAGGIGVPLEAAGLAGDVLIDLAKGESVRDEGRKGYVNPLHSVPFLPRRLRGPMKYLYGIHKDGKIDWRW